MKMTKENLYESLINYFGFNDPDGTYTYELTRVKSAFNVGTITMDDFEEYTEEQVDDLANFIWDLFAK